MSAVGAYLRELREKRGVSLEEIARSTRVARHYLEALEADDFASLPAGVFTRGFIRAYCNVLGEAPDEALARFDAREGATGASAPRPVAPREPEETASRARGAVLVSFVLLVILGVALFVVTLMIGSRPPDQPAPTVAVPAAPRPTPAPGAPNATAVPAPRRAPPAPATAPTTAAPSPAAPIAAAGPPEPVADLQALATVTSPYRLIARTTEPTWIRVRTEDGRSSEETVPAGEIREWVSNRPFVLTIGNAGGVTLELNGRTLPPLGARGAVISRLVLPPEPQ